MPIHPSHQPQARHTFTVVAGLFFIALAIGIAPMPLQAQGLAQYLPLHMALETMAIAIAFLTFSTVWSARQKEHLPRHTLLLASAFLAVGILDFSHMLSFQGMPDFITPSSPQKAIAFWLVARLLGATALLAVALPWGKQKTKLVPYKLFLGSIFLAIVLNAVIIKYLHIFPETFIPNQGLTNFKIGFEYFIVIISLLTSVLFFSYFYKTRYFSVSNLFAASCLMALSGYFFTLYGEVTDIYNLVGHVYKVIAYIFLYRALFVESVQKPYVLLDNSQKKLKAMLNAMPDLLFEIDAQGQYLQVHTRHIDELAAPEDFLIGKTLHQVLPQKQADIVMSALWEASQYGVSRGKTIAIKVLGGQNSFFELSVAKMEGDTAESESFVVISRDVTERQKTEETLRQLSQAVEQSPISMVITDLDARIQYVNAAFTRKTGYSSIEAIGQNPRILHSGKTPESTYQSMWANLTTGKSWQGEIINRSKEGCEFVEWVLIYPLRNTEGVVTHYLAHKEDITEKKQAIERIERLSQHDSLTGLPNRNLIQQYFYKNQEQRQKQVFLWIDLDHFKNINDAFGHNTGDILLLEISGRLRATLRNQDVLSRHAGDDFIAILPGIESDNILVIVQKILNSLSLPFQIQGQDFNITASIGIAVYPDDGQQFENLLQNAETAMYRVKEEGRNNYCFFTSKMQERTSRILALSNALKQAQQRNELHLVYQPQLSLENGKIIAAEALLRWNSPQWGNISPGEFIPIIENNGLIIPIGEWVLREVLVQLHQWLDRGLPPITIAVNLSAVQFDQPHLAELIDNLLQEINIPAQCLELEITEAVAMKSPEIAAQRILEFNQKGIKISIDDFGTGYSSLSYLKRFCIDKIKIDQSFVRDLHIDAEDQAIVVAIIQLSRSLGLTTIAEGVETAEQLEFLREWGCDEIQGYYISRPLPPEDFFKFYQEKSIFLTPSAVPSKQIDAF